MLAPTDPSPVRGRPGGGVRRQSDPVPPPPTPPHGEGGEGAREFGDSAVTLCALAARALGWRPGEFWAATPAELAACLADPGAQGTATPAPLARADLTRLMEGDPDAQSDGRC